MMRDPEKELRRRFEARSAGRAVVFLSFHGRKDAVMILCPPDHSTRPFGFLTCSGTFLTAPRRAGSETLRLWLHTRLPQAITSATFFKESSAGAVAHRSRGWSRAQPSARREQKPSGTMVGGTSSQEGADALFATGRH